MKRVLFVATVDGHILAFHIPYLKYFKELGYEVHVASNGCNEIPFCDIKHNIPFERSPLKLKNIEAYKQLKKIIDTNNFSIIHCHTPVGGVVARLAARSARRTHGTKVLYTAHGFHFFKGAPLINWLLYFPMEVFLSRYTDGIITMNSEDYTTAPKWMKCNIHFTHGVGVDENRFNAKNFDKTTLRAQYGYSDSSFIMIYIAELSKRKNQTFLLDILKEVERTIPNCILLIVGKGPKREALEGKAFSLNIDKKVQFLGFRKDIPELLTIADICISTSLQEGLPVNIIESLAMGLPVIASEIRGHVDLIQNSKNGYLCSLNKKSDFIDAINSTFIKKLLINRPEEYLLSNVVKEIESIYKLYLP